uniref:Uncharacterized protein n=1 Tax=Arundo donax TaxID=35708 RepID=A0A0A9CPD6_ARUDO
MHLGRWLVPCRRAPITVREREARVLRHGGDDGLLVEALPEINDLLLQPDNLLLEDCNFGEKLQCLRRKVRWEARQSTQRPGERPL